MSLASPTGISSVTTRGHSASLTFPFIEPTLLTVTELCVCLTFERSPSVAVFNETGLPRPSTPPAAERFTSVFLASAFFRMGGPAPHSRDTEL